MHTFIWAPTYVMATFAIICGNDVPAEIENLKMVFMNDNLCC